MYIDGSPVLHVVDEATRFQAAKWLKNMSSQHIWEALRMCWIDVYLGPPDIINHDAGTNFTSHEFLQNAQALAIETKTAPVESANSMGIVERYHKPLRRAYEIIKEDLGTNNSLEQKAMVLQMVTKATNDTAGYDGIVPTLLVFGAFPRISNIDPPAPSIAKRAAAIRKAMLEVSKLRAKRQVTDALRTRNGPVTSDIPIGSDVLVWRVHENSWNGPYKILAINGETATVQMPHGPANFRSTNIKLYNHPTNANNELKIENTSSPINADNSRRRQPVRNAGLPTRYQDSVYLNEESKPNFSVSRRKELDGLLERGVFEFINVNDIPTGARIFKSRFVDQIKNAGTANAFEKSRLVVQAYNDSDKKKVLTQSPTIQRASQRLLLCLAIYKDFNVFTRDISQAYTQSKSKLVRDFYVHPPAELNLPDGILLKVLLPLYGVPEAGTHWFHTYHDHHVKNLNLKQSKYDPCLLFSSDALVGLQTDDTLIACDNNFKCKENEELQKANFAAKPLQELTKENSIIFNGAHITKTEQSIQVSQINQVKKLSLLKDEDKNNYVSQRARGAYISSVCQPQVAFGLSFAAQIINPTKTDVDRLNESLKWQKQNESKGLKYVKLNGKLRLIVFTDSSFANNPDLSSQIGYLLILADEFDNCNVIHKSWT